MGNTLTKYVLALLRGALTPAFVAAVSMLVGCGLLIAGVFVMLGLGPALLAGAVPLLLLAAVIIRGMRYAG